MSRTQKIRSAAALFLVLVVSMPPALAAAPISVKGRVVSTLCHFLRGLWEKEGSSVDPNGKRASSLPFCAKADAGSSLDPSGRKHQKADEGSSVDPDGLRRATADSGSSLDPSGRL
jgi:hypothetical protein